MIEPTRENYDAAVDLLKGPGGGERVTARAQVLATLAVADALDLLYRAQVGALPAHDVNLDD